MKNVTTLNTAVSTLTAAIVKAVTGKEGKFAFEGHDVDMPVQEVLLRSAMSQIKEPTLLTLVGGKAPFYMLSLVKAVKAQGAKKVEEATDDTNEEEQEEEFDIKAALAALELDQLKELAGNMEVEIGRKKEAGIIKLLLADEDSATDAYNEMFNGEEAADEEEEEQLDEEAIRDMAIELGMKKKAAKKASIEELQAFITENTEEDSTDEDGSDEGGEVEGGFIYVVFEDEDDAEEAVRALTKILEKNDFSAKDIEATIGHNGEDDEDEYAHVFIDDKEFDNSLKAGLKKFAKKADLEETEDFTVFTEEQYLAKFNEEAGSEEEEEEVLAAIAFLSTLTELKANKGKAKGRKTLVAELMEINWEKPTAANWKALEEAADMTSEADDIMEAIETLQGALEGKELKAFDKAFKEWF